MSFTIASALSRIDPGSMTTSRNSPGRVMSSFYVCSLARLGIDNEADPGLKHIYLCVLHCRHARHPPTAGKGKCYIIGRLDSATICG